MVADKLQLPMQVTSRQDVSRLQHELEAVDNFLGQAAIRKSGHSLQLPKTSRLFEDMVSSNKLNMLQAPDRLTLGKFLQAIHDEAPILHMSFGVDPSSLFTQRLSTWLRQNIHPHVLLQIGLQPNLGAGCVMRSTNKYFDFSLRQQFSATKELLIEQIRGQEPVASTSPQSEAKAA